MANGLFLGGFAQGAKNASDIGVNEGTLQLNQQIEGSRQKRLDVQEAQSAISNTLNVVSEVITNAKASGASNEKINQIIAPLMNDVNTISKGAGIDPSRFVNSVRATIDTAQSNLPGDRAVQEIQGKERAAQELSKITGIDITKARQQLGMVPEEVSQGSDGSTGISKPTKSMLEKDIVNTGRILDTLNASASAYNDKYLTRIGRMQIAFATEADKWGAASDQQKELIRGYTRFSNEVEQMFNSYRKDVTGAAAAQKELDMLKKAILNKDNSPEQFKSALDQFREFANRKLEESQRLLGSDFGSGRAQDEPLPSKQRVDSWFRGVVDEAKAALASGKSRAAIENVLREQGIDPRLLDQ